MIGLMLAYRPILDPLDLHGVWYLLLLPLSVMLAMAFKAARVRDGDDGKLPIMVYLRQSIVFTIQIILGMVGLYALALLVVTVLLPMAV